MDFGFYLVVSITLLQHIFMILKLAIEITQSKTPLISLLSILNYVDLEDKVLGYGISLILLNAEMYFVSPEIVIYSIRKRF